MFDNDAVEQAARAIEPDAWSDMSDMEWFEQYGQDSVNEAIADRNRRKRTSLVKARAALAAARAGEAESPVIDAEHIAHQRAFSLATFGPGLRTDGVLDHIAKESAEVRQDPTDLGEWVDIIILAFDGAHRTGADPQAIIDAIKTKQARNEARTWPDWRVAEPGKAIEHDRTGEPAQRGAEAVDAALAARGDAATPTEVEWGVREASGAETHYGSGVTAEVAARRILSIADGFTLIQRTVSAWREVS